MAKVTGKFDTRNPFIPSQSNVCRLAETYVVVSVVAASVIGCLVTVFRLFVE